MSSLFPGSGGHLGSSKPATSDRDRPRSLTCQG
jgi:hypothetical protein